MSEITFLVDETDDDGLVARSVEASIFTDATGLDELRRNVREAVICHFDDERQRPTRIRLRFATQDEVIDM